MSESLERNRTPSHDEMESLFVNNELFDTLAASLNQFNPIKVMRMERMEIRHSAILAWLLDPQETHGFGDQFLKSFLSEAMRGRSDLGSPTALDISQSDLRDAEVRREWRNMDIFILSAQNRWAFIVENKFDSQQSEGQLSGYMEKASKVFGGKAEMLTSRGVFLTLHDEEPEDARYAPIKYSQICELLPRLVDQEAERIAPSVRVFLDQYLEIVREATSMSEAQDEMERLARRLYKEHKKVLDFVIEHGASSDFAVAARTLFGDNPDHFEKIEIDDASYRFGSLYNDKVSFLPESWFSALGGGELQWPGCETWWDGFPLIMWLQILRNAEGSGGEIRLYAEVGPLTNYEFRKKLIEEIQAVGDKLSSSKIRFQSGATGEERQFSKFFKDNSTTVRDVQDADELSGEMKTLLNSFQTEIEEIAKVYSQFATYAVVDK